MQINVLEYLAATLRTRPTATAVIDGAVRYSFAEIAELGRRCAWLIGQLTENRNRPASGSRSGAATAGWNGRSKDDRRRAGTGANQRVQLS